MQSLSPSALLGVWDLGVGLLPYERALVVLRAAGDAAGDETLWALPLGDRDARLMRVREATFGSRMHARSPCPRCPGVAEFELTTTEILARHPPDLPACVVVHDGDVGITARLPSTADVARAASVVTDDPATDLAIGCIETVTQGAEPLAPGTISAATLAALAEAMREADPLADVVVELACPDCSERWETTFDIAAYLWDEVEAEARRIIHEVDVLARAYGWRERDVLQLSDQRRQAYLELAG